MRTQPLDHNRSTQGRNLPKPRALPELSPTRRTLARFRSCRLTQLWHHKTTNPTIYITPHSPACPVQFFVSLLMHLLHKGEIPSFKMSQAQKIGLDLIVHPVTRDLGQSNILEYKLKKMQKHDLVSSCHLLDSLQLH